MHTLLRLYASTYRTGCAVSEIVARDKDSTNGRIAACLLAHFDEVKWVSIRELAVKMYESATSISHFCQDIGLQGFNELKILLAKNMCLF